MHLNKFWKTRGKKTISFSRPCKFTWYMRFSVFMIFSLRDKFDEESPGKGISGPLR